MPGKWHIARLRAMPIAGRENENESENAMSTRVIQKNERGEYVIRYLTDDTARGIAAGSEFLVGTQPTSGTVSEQDLAALHILGAAYDAHSHNGAAIAAAHLLTLGVSPLSITWALDVIAGGAR